MRKTTPIFHLVHLEYCYETCPNLLITSSSFTNLGECHKYKSKLVYDRCIHEYLRSQECIKEYGKFNDIN